MGRCHESFGIICSAFTVQHPVAFHLHVTNFISPRCGLTSPADGWQIYQLNFHMTRNQIIDPVHCSCKSVAWPLVANVGCPLDSGGNDGRLNTKDLIKHEGLRVITRSTQIVQQGSNYAGRTY